jgi:pSer/pThr/pTyr-binding forkhead associated (FHA) protein
MSSRELDRAEVCKPQDAQGPDNGPQMPTGEGARLVSLDNAGDILVGKAPVVVGRLPACDARLDSARVSRLHCCLTAVGAEVAVRDLGSTNGTRINGLRVGHGRLRPGDILFVAHYRFRFDAEPLMPQNGIDPI